MRRASIFAALSLALFGAAPDRRPTAGETIDVSIVNVDVFVTDKAGNRVRGLSRDDFEIFENGARQPLTHFAEYASKENGTVGVDAGTAAVTPDSATPVAAPQRRTIAVFVERFRLPKPLADPVFASMKKLLHGAVRPGDTATVVTWYKGHLQTLQTYTDDLAAIDRALDAIARQNTSAAHDEFAEQRAWYDDIDDFDLTAEQFAAEAGAASAVPILHAGNDDMKEMSSRMNAKREFADLELKVATVNALMRSMSGFDGKRVLLLATHRLSAIAGAEHFFAAGLNAELDSVDRIALDTRRIMKSLYDTANANGVAVYPMFPEGVVAAPRISPEGLYKPGDVRGTMGLGNQPGHPKYVASAYDYLIQNNETPVLQTVARQTGGLAAWGSSDVAKLLNVIRDDLDSYYSLAYRATARSSDRSRDVVVKTRRPGLLVRSRREVIEKSDTRRMKDRIVGTLFRNGDPSARLEFVVKVGRREARGRKLRVPITLRIPISALYTAPGASGFTGAFGVYVAWGSKIGGVSDATRERRAFTIPTADFDRAQRSYFTYDFEIAINDTTERVAIGVSDEASREYGVKVIDIATLPPPAAVPARR